MEQPKRKRSRASHGWGRQAGEVGGARIKVCFVFSAVLHIELEAKRFENRRLEGTILEFADGMF
jgi:hypothetical protein